MQGYSSPDVYALAVGPDGSLYAGGAFTRANWVVVNRIARWDGSQWHPLGSGLDGYGYALAVGPDGALVVGGSFNTAGGKPSARTARWTGAVARNPVAWFPIALVDP
jgi:hypothetical protein